MSPRFVGEARGENIVVYKLLLCLIRFDRTHKTQDEHLPFPGRLNGFFCIFLPYCRRLLRNTKRVGDGQWFCIRCIGYQRSFQFLKSQVALGMYRKNIGERVAREGVTTNGFIDADIESLLESSFAKCAVQERSCRNSKWGIYFVS